MRYQHNLYNAKRTFSGLQLVADIMGLSSFF